MRNASLFFFKAFLTIDLKRLSALSVTEQVLITYTSAFSLKSTRLKPSLTKLRAIVDVSEKFSLHPKV